MKSPLLLSRAGSDRATGYATSNKIIRHDGKIFVGWLDAPQFPGGPESIQLGVCDARSGGLLRAFSLGEGSDNHCGPALAVEGNGRLHAILGAHNGAFLHRYSDNPEDPTQWSSPHVMGPFDTYPSLVVDAQDTLHLMSRESGPHPRKLIYRRKRAAASWEAPVVIALSPQPGYTHFMQSLSVGPQGRLHATFQYHFALNSPDATGRSAGHISSDDGGKTWQQDQTTITLPLTWETTRAFRTAPDGGIRISNHVVDSQDRVWIFSAVPEKPGGILFRRDATGWSEIDTRKNLDTLDNRNGREVSLSRDSAGFLHLVIGTAPGGLPSQWKDPRHELFHLILDEDGKQHFFGQITETDPTQAHWLPSVENWDWVRPRRPDAPLMLFTQESTMRSEGIPQTKVFLTQLAKVNPL